MRGQCFFTFEDIISSRRGIILLLLLTLAAFRHNMGYNQITFSQFPFVFLHHIIQMAFLLIHLHHIISERHFGFRPFSHCLSSSKFICSCISFHEERSGVLFATSKRQTRRQISLHRMREM